MKNVGVHVAADALALGNLAGAHPEGGAVLISGEDPWCDSTQVPADSRFLFEHLRMPVIEAGAPQQVKDWINLSFKLSRAAGLYIGYIVTTAQADGGGTVECSPNQWPTLNTKQRVALETPQIDLNKVLLPPRTWQEELKIPDRFAKTMAKARELGINRIIPATQNSALDTEHSLFSDRLHRHRHGRPLSPARPGRHRPHRHLPHPPNGHELPRRRPTRLGVRNALQEHDRHRGTPLLPRKEHPRHDVQRPAARPGRVDRRPTLRQDLSHHVRRPQARRHPPPPADFTLPSSRKSSFR